MDIIEFLTSRRSIRKYTDVPISMQQIQDLIKAGMFAPTAKNCQPWHFIVIKNRETLNNIIEFSPNASMLKYADTAILVCGDKTAISPDGYVILDCTAATMNILTAAHGLGLGACWLGVFPIEERMKQISKLLNLPENIIPVNLISLGNTDQVKDKPERFNKDKIHIDQW